MTLPQRHTLVQIGDAVAALRSSEVAEILPNVALTRPRGAPGVLAGFAAVGDEVLTVIDAAKVLEGASDAAADPLYRHILRLAPRLGAPPLGLLVDRVTAVDAVAADESPVDPAQSVNGAVVATLALDDRLVPLVDVGKLLLAEEAQRLEELAATVRRRLDQLGPAGA